MFFQNRRGLEAGIIIKWLIALAVLVVVLLYVVPKIPLFAGSVSKVTTCGGASLGGKQGVCVPESQYCNEKILSGCESYPDKPVCCFDSSVVNSAQTGKNCLFIVDGSQVKDIIMGVGLSSYTSNQDCQNNCKVSADDNNNFNNPRRRCVDDNELQKRVACLDPSTFAYRSCYPLEQCVLQMGIQGEALRALSDTLNNIPNAGFNPANIKCICEYSTQCQ